MRRRGTSGSSRFCFVRWSVKASAELSHFPLELPNGVAQIRQSLKSHQLSRCFSHRTGRCSQICLAPGHVSMHAGLGSYYRTIAKVHMVCDPHLTRTYDIVPGGN